MGARSLHCVRVMTDDRTQQLWVAATARDEAVDCVLDVISEGWTARLLDEQFESQADLASDMAPGEARKPCETKRWSEMH
jgi:hypothetical protein